ncbi:MAG TPA: hypothetical protein VNL18_00245 [Gemmatimonadales bacterium]|nr:hypothetical protein [Gemmatimonadales bacterium]
MAGTAFLQKPFASIALASVRLATGALKDGRVRNRLHVVCDGAEATDFLHRRGTHARLSVRT